MAEEPTPVRESHLLPIDSESSSSNNGFWNRVRRIEANLAEIRKLIDEIKEAGL